MISDVVGFKKESGEWVSGSYGDKRLGEVKADRLLWYRQALIEFNNNILSHIRVGNAAKDRRRVRRLKEPKSKTPMLDSKYNHKRTDYSGFENYSGGVI